MNLKKENLRQFFIYLYKQGRILLSKFLKEFRFFYLIYLKRDKSCKKIYSGWYVIKIKDEKSKCKINSVNKLFSNIRKNKLTKNYSEINLDWKEKYFDLQKQFRRSLMKLNISRTIAIIFCIALIVTNSAQYFPHFSKAATYDWTVTSQSDWNAGTKTNVDIATTPGDVVLDPSVFGSDWTSLAGVSGIINSGGAITYDGTYIYALRGGSTTDFYRYDISGNSWSAMTSVTAAVGAGGSLIFDGTYIYALRGGSTTDFYRYDISGNSWSAMTSVSGAVGAGGSLTYDGTYIYALRGAGTTDFYRYNISGNSWSSMTSFSVVAGWTSGLEAWRYRNTISLSPVTPSTNYQIKVLLTTSNFDYSHSLGSNGADLRFTSTGGTNLDYWIKTWNASGTSTIYVEVATASTSAIYMYYGNAAASAGSSYDNTFTKTFGETGLKGLWHMDDASGTTVTDSSGNSNTGTLGGGTADYQPTWVGADGGEWDGINQQFATGDSLTFDGNNDYISAGNGSSLNLTTAISISAWVKKSEVDRTETILSKGPYSLRIGEDNKPYMELIQSSATIASTGGLGSNDYLLCFAVYDGKLYEGTQSSGSVYRYDGGTTWTNVGQLGSNGAVVSLVVYNGYLYGGTYSDGHVYRYDGGTTWTDVGQAGVGTTSVQSLAVYEGNLYANTYGQHHVYRYDGGTTWTDVGAVGSGYVTGLIVYNGKLYGGTSTSGHVYRYDGGTTWTDIGQAGAGWAWSFTVYNGSLYAGTEGHVYRYDGGTTWTDVGAVGSVTFLESLIVYNNKLYGQGDGTGKLYRYDGGTTWTDMGTVGSNTRLFSAGVYNGKLYVGGNDRNVYSFGGPGVGAYSSTAISTDWAHVVGTYDGITAKIYVNGVLTGSTAATVTIATNTDNLLIGQSLGSSLGGVSIGGEDNFYGKMDEVRLYNRALSLEEIITQYERRLYTASEPTATLDTEVLGGVGGGGSLLKAGNYIYALRGGNYTDFYRYNISENSWSAMASISGTVNIGGALAFDDTYIYALRGGGSPNSYYYNISENSWSAMTDFPSISGWTTTMRSWQYRWPVTLDNTAGGALSDYQMKINDLDTQTLISAGKMKSDCADIRFIDSDLTTALNYWVEPGTCNTATTDIWVKVPSISASSTKTIYLYYGNSAADSVSSTTNTFIRELSGTVGTWNFDEGTGLVANDTSGGGNTGTVSAGAAWTSSGKFGNAIDFTAANSSVNLGKVPTGLTKTTSHTASLWVKGNEVSSHLKFPLSIGLSTLVVGTSTNKILVTRYSADPACGGEGGHDSISAGTYDWSTWHHLVFTYNGDNTYDKIYVDGTDVTTPTTGWCISNGNDTVFGYDLVLATLKWNGLIDDIEIYNTALTAPEITDLYNNHGYATTNYPGKVLVRKYTATVPTVSFGTEITGGADTGGAMVRAGTSIYALRGGGYTDFYKYSFVFAGNITNLRKDAGGDAGWNTISWNSTVPANTLVKFRTRTAATEGGLSGASWSDWYTSSPADITSGINRWCEVEAYLQSTVSGTSPTISDLTVNYSINAPPELQTLTASQGSDGLVNISYQVRDTDTNDGEEAHRGKATISFQYWDGSQWQEATTTVGEGVKNVATSPATDWTTYTGTWDPKTDYNNHYTANGMKIKVTADDLELVYNTATLESSTFELDTVNPASPSIKVNASTQYDSHETSLTLSVTDSTMQSGVKGSMMISLDSGFSGASWQTYNTASTITLADNPDTVYVKFKDDKGNVSATASVTTPQTPECIMSQDTSNVRIVPNEYRLFVAWEVVEVPPQGTFDHYSIQRSTTNNDDDFTEVTTIANRETNYYTDTTPNYNVLYYYKVFAYDSLNNISYRSNAVTGKANGIQDSGEGGGGTDITAPTVSSVASTDVYTSQATITWTTDEFADSTVGYGNATSTLVYLNSPTMTKNHSVTLTNLSTDNYYYYSVKSKDPSNNETTDNNLGNYYNFTTLPGPIVSNISVSQISNNTARITWLTDISSNSYVVYSTHSDLSGSTTHGSITKISSPNSQNYYEHSVDLTDLVSGNRYYFYVESYDGSDVGIDNNQGNYYFFNTTYDFTPPEITLISAANTAYTSTVTWLTDELATSQVEYGTTIAYGTLSPSSVTTTDLTIDHVIRLADLTEGTTYHYRVRSQDANGNESISNDYSFIPAREGDYTKPIISSVQIPSGSLFTTQATITWTTNELSDSTVEYSATQGVYSSSKNSTSMVISHSLVITDLTPGTIYYFRVKSTDFSTNTQTDNNGGVGYSLTTKSGSIISNVYVASVVNETATIKWSTNSDSGSKVVYSSSANLSNPQTKTEATLTTTHSVDLISLYPNVIYYFYVESEDAQDNISRSDNQGVYYYFTTADDQSAPEINSVSSAATAYTATITWETDELATSQMEYGFTTDYGTETDLDSQLTIQHVVHLTNLTNDQTYHFRVKSKDANNNESTSNDYNFITTQEAEPIDTTAPVISEVNSYATETIGTITWKTDDSATSQIEYGSTTAYGTSTTLNSNLTTEHMIRLTDLTSEQIYHYRIKSKNDADLETISQDYTLTPQYVSQEIRVVAGGGGTVARDETPPVVSNIKVSDIKETSAVVTWTTDERATSLIDYGLTSAYTNTAHDSLTLATNHQITLSNLTKGTVYHYQVLSQDSSSNLRKSSDVTFTTLGGIVPITPTPENQNPSTPASSEGEGGSTTIAPVNNVDKNFIAAMEEAKSLSSQVTAPVLENAFQDILDTLKDITPGPVIEKNPVVEVSATEAIIRWETNKRSNSMIAFVKASDFDKSKSEPYSQIIGQSNEHQLTHGVRIINLTPSTEYYFQTRSKGLIGSETKSKQYNFKTASQVPEVITFSIKDVSTRAATFVWQTNIPTNSQVKYIPYRNNKLSSGEAQTINKSEFNITHEIIIKNFAPGTTYNISLEGKDSEGNNYSFLIPNFTTVKDSTSPIISQIRTSVALSSRGDEVQTIITWNTDEPANSQFEYQVGFAEDAPVVQMSKDITLKQDHLIVVTSFKPGSIYRFRVISEDSSGNKTQSTTNTLLTPQKKLTVTELIFKNFQQTFGWMKGMGAKF
ncbi:MAG: DUF2341 domain-containing protein [Patescibacteria group bacterium]|jgi:hypothetical protein